MPKELNHNAEKEGKERITNKKFPTKAFQQLLPSALGLAVFAFFFLFFTRQAFASYTFGFVSDIHVDGVTQSRTDQFNALIQYLIDNEVASNIKFFGIAGDLTTSDSSSTPPYAIINAALDNLEASTTIPYGFATGNHDIYTAGQTEYNSHYSSKSWYGDCYPTADCVNPKAIYIPINIDDNNKWGGIIINYYSTDTGLTAWMNGIFDANSDRKFIVNLHVYGDNTYGPCVSGYLYCYPTYTTMYGSGRDLWSNSLSRYSNVKMVVSGHTHFTGYNEQWVGVNGNIVHQLSVGNANSGAIVFATVDPNANSLQLTRYSNIASSTLDDTWGTNGVATLELDTSSSSLPTINSFAVSTSTVAAGQQVTFSWSVAENPAATITIDNGIGTVSPSSTASVIPRATTTYTLTAANANGSVTASVTVNVSQPAEPAAPSWYNSDWLYRKSITADHFQVGGGVEDETDFPLLVSVTDPDLKTAANGGKVANDQGYDFLFTDSSGNKLPHEIESYASSTGQLIAWVKTGLYYTAINKIYLYFGNASTVSSNEDTANTWANYGFVHHMDETSGTNINDSTPNNNDGTKLGASNPSPATGAIKGGQSFVGMTRDKVTIGDSPSWDTASAQYSFGLWVKATQISANYWSAFYGQDQTRLLLRVADLGGGQYGWILKLGTTGTSCVITSSAVPWMSSMDGNFHLLTAVHDGAKCYLYADGTKIGSANSTGNTSFGTVGSLALGNPNAYADNLILDEFRALPGTAITASRALTEYNNVSSSTFLTFGSLDDGSPPAITLTSPASGASLSGTAALTATSTDLVGVAGIKFYYDSTHLIGSEVVATSSPDTYQTTLNTTALSDGSHTLIAVARDSFGNTTTSTPVTVTVSNNTASGSRIDPASYSPPIAPTGGDRSPKICKPSPHRYNG